MTTSIPNSADVPAVLTADEAAALLRVDRKTIYAAVREGTMPGVIRIGRTLRFLRAELLRSDRQGRVVPNERTGQ